MTTLEFVQKEIEQVTSMMSQTILERVEKAQFYSKNKEDKFLPAMRLEWYMDKNIPKYNINYNGIPEEERPYVCFCWYSSDYRGNMDTAIYHFLLSNGIILSSSNRSGIHQLDLPKTTKPVGIVTRHLIDVLYGMHSSNFLYDLDMYEKYLDEYLKHAREFIRLTNVYYKSLENKEISQEKSNQLHDQLKKKYSCYPAPSVFKISWDEFVDNVRKGTERSIPYRKCYTNPRNTPRIVDGGGNRATDRITAFISNYLYNQRHTLPQVEQVQSLQLKIKKEEAELEEKIKQNDKKIEELVNKRMEEEKLKLSLKMEQIEKERLELKEYREQTKRELIEERSKMALSITKEFEEREKEFNQWMVAEKKNKDTETIEKIETRVRAVLSKYESTFSSIFYGSLNSNCPDGHLVKYKEGLYSSKPAEVYIRVNGEINHSSIVYDLIPKSLEYHDCIITDISSVGDDIYSLYKSYWDRQKAQFSFVKVL